MDTGVVSRVGVNQPRCDVDHSPPFSVEVKNEWSCASTPPVGVDHKDKRQISLTHMWAAYCHAENRFLYPSGFIIFNYALQLLRLIVRSWLDVQTFATRRLHARATSGGKWNCGREMSGNFA